MGLRRFEVDWTEGGGGELNGVSVDDARDRLLLFLTVGAGESEHCQACREGAGGFGTEVSPLATAVGDVMYISFADTWPFWLSPWLKCYHVQPI